MNGNDGEENGPPSRWSRADTIAFWLITLGAAALRIARLNIPSNIMFDERYYAKDSCWYVLASESACALEGPQAEVHPPLAKWLMAVGIRIFGFDAFGWRIVAAVAGVVTVALTYLLARRLLGSMLGAVIASGLLAVDFLHFVQSRISMLEIFVPLFGVAAVLFVVYDRDQLANARAGPPDESAASEATVPPRPRALLRPWRLAAGLAAGAAVASKWSGGAFLLVAIALTLVWETDARREDGWQGAFRRALREEGASMVVAFLVAPVLLYVVTHIGRVEGAFLALPWSEGSWIRTLWERQFYFADFHHELDASHPYQSPPWTWLLLKRPVAYFFETQPDGDYREILGTGNPFVWWTSVLALVAAAVSLRRRRNVWGPELVIAGAFALTYLPWFALSLGRESVFLFYMLPSVPFMCLALGWVATKLGNSWEARATVGIFAAASVGLFAFYYPLLANVPIPRESWEKRIWIFEDCERPAKRTVTSTITETIEGTEFFRTTETTDEDDNPPPTGWCWI